jgi:hypothetical protein
MSPKARFQMMLEPDQLEALRTLQDVTGAAMAEHIRRAIAQYLASKEIRKMLKSKSRK